MAELEKALVQLRKWAAEPGPPPQIDQKLVHKAQKQNVLVSRFAAIDENVPDEFVGQLWIEKDHPFFFEHPLDHLPGLMLIEAGRQMGTAVAHVEYGVPHDTAFILNEVVVKFSSFAELGPPVFVNSTVRDKTYKRGALTAMRYAGHFVQNEKEVGFMSGVWHLYPPKIIARMRRAALKTS